MATSGLGDEMNLVPTDKHTLQAKAAPNIFVLGDATNLPTPKTVSVAHFQAEVVFANIMRLIAGEAPQSKFDGHANWFVESGDGKAILIDSSYDVEPLPGKFPFRTVGPLSLLKETRMNHWANLLFRWSYWNLLLPARGSPIGSDFSMAGKKAA